MAPKTASFRLPPGIIGPSDVVRLSREAESANEAMRQAALRTGGEPARLPRLSRSLNELLEANGLNFLLEDDRERLMAVLAYLTSEAPSCHISFSVDPSSVFLQKLVTWLRREIHPYILIRVGLQPTIGAGCVIRTTNHYFDFSLREHFKKQRQGLIEALSRGAQS